jgi:hypothetical protein
VMDADRFHDVDYGTRSGRLPTYLVTLLSIVTL